MDKQYDHQATEEKWYKFWEESGFFKADPTSKNKPYGILMPPPNVNGEPHMGHAMQHAILDAMARFKRLQGYDVLLLPGIDHAGIQFESTFNKILEKEGLSKQKLGRDAWLKKAWQFRNKIYQTFHSTWIIFGISADWSREIFTLDPQVQNAVLKEFKTYFEQDLLYKGAYIVQWCPKDATAIEDIEMEYEERKEKLCFIKYKIAGTNEYITIATARPETIAADVAIAIYPNHPKYAKFLNKNAINPFTNVEIPIIEDKRVEKGFGTGALKITPGHDLLDYEIGKDHNLPILHVIDKTGKITDLDPNLHGLKVLEAREKAVQILADHIEKIEDYTHSVPVCERCKTVVEPLISEEWFVKMAPLADKALKHIKKINFVPKNYLKILSAWIKNIHDWSISRSLWWGHRIPVWYCGKCNPNHEVGKNKDMIISIEEPEKSCQTCSQKHWVQDEQVLDAWFSSGMWPLATLGWPNQTIEFKRYYPWDFEITAPEIKYLWIARMVMLGLWFADEIPFKNMFFHGTIRDLQGRKMSKSLGNGVDPIELIKQWGTDAVRMTLYSYSTPGRDPKANKQTMDERAKNFRNFTTKLWNIGKFIAVIPSGTRNLSRMRALNKDDKWIMEELNKTIKSVTKNLEEFKLHLAIEALYEFIWHKLADIYIEKSKDRRSEAQPTLKYVFKTSLELLHPFMPFITEDLWQKLVLSESEGLPHTDKSIMIAKWPTVQGL